eukprot:TRINITY_DN2464_c0_g1_i1.p1 TRINITY_DN2464_c0_g1~~TRINITY_DN2464_c0_g1_i1.p1  ORF type:complete len:945 (-),score=214.27 TRINITY_DN2464_c0_g1_i1:516-3350(-)
MQLQTQTTNSPIHSSLLFSNTCITKASAWHSFGRLNFFRSNTFSKNRLVARAVTSESKKETLPKESTEVDSSSLATNIKYHAEFTPHFSPYTFGLPQTFVATAESVRDFLIQRWNSTQLYYDEINPKQTYYLSMEFLQGRALLNAVGNLELTDAYADALKSLGTTLEAVALQEPDAALGNGGLGRLASCFLDSLATLDYPAWGYGLRYKYGLFQQVITKDGQQEAAESWLEMGNPWEIARYDIQYDIKFFGKVENRPDETKHWVGGEDVKVMAYDVPIPGYKTKTTLSLRLWSTLVQAKDFDLQAFNAGEHVKATEAQQNAEKICYILYPGDESTEGKVLRLKQQYTLCSASLQDIISRFKKRSGQNLDWEKFPEKVALQMNDTHPTLSVVELMRILIDVEGLPWNKAWKITQRTIAYTNHTVLPEALEKWPFEIMKKLLPRHVEIVTAIDEEFIKETVVLNSSTDLKLLESKVRGMRILENADFPESVVPVFSDLWESEESSRITQNGEPEGTDDKNVKTETEDENENESSIAPTVNKPAILVRMANLCVIASHTVNGVAEIHSDIVKNEVFNDFHQMWPAKFQNKTNGVTPRRWIHFCNPELSNVITKWLGGEEWVVKTEKLAELRNFVYNKELWKDWREAKRKNKVKLVSYIKQKTGYDIKPDCMFDIQVKRIHEYKRQLLNIFGIVYKYKKMKEMSPEERKRKFVPRVCLFGGKAFATYVQAKRIVKLITDVGNTVNHDEEIGDLLKVIFVPDYNVSVAEILIPASELSQHISTAGMEASGTSNMKFAMNGCLLIGTLDGANVEIREEVGEENFFLFGSRAHEIAGLRKERAEGKFKPDPRFEETKDYIKSGIFGKYDYRPLLDSLEGNEGFGRGDYFLVGKDFPAYIECQAKVDEAYRDQEKWTRMSILNTAGSYKFSSDRTIHEYAKEIWDIKQIPVQ